MSQNTLHCKNRAGLDLGLAARRLGSIAVKTRASILDSSFKISPAFFANRTKMADEYEFYLQASVRGYHAYFKESTVHVGDILDCEMEPENDHDRYAVAVKNKDEKIVGHVPIELSRICHKFLSEYGQLEAECIGSRFNTGQGKGLELPVDYRFVGNARYLRKVFTRLQKKQEEEEVDWKISGITKV